MKEYPSILKEQNKDLSYYVFDKLDGSNIRAEWSKKQGFCKFGSRHVLLDENDTNNKLSIAPALIKEKYQDVSVILKKMNVERATLFFEFYGEQSFAGNHVEFNDNKKVVLFDVDLYKKGLMMPDDYLKSFGHLDIAPLLYHGKVHSDLFDAVKLSQLEGMTFEGVVCKARPANKKPQPFMFKIKSQAWLDKLHHFCGDDAELFKKLM